MYETKIAKEIGIARKKINCCEMYQKILFFIFLINPRSGSFSLKIMSIIHNCLPPFIHSKINKLQNSFILFIFIYLILYISHKVNLWT